MSESKPDRWNSLLETLGIPAGEQKSTVPAGESQAAQSSSEQPAAAGGAVEGGSPPAEKRQVVSMLRPEKPRAAAKAAKPAAKPAPKSPSYWSRIAGALGLEVPAPPEAEPIAEQPVAQAPIAPAPPEPRSERAEEEPLPSWRAPEPASEPELPPRAFERPRREERGPRQQRPGREERGGYEQRSTRETREERPAREQRPARGERGAREERVSREERPAREERATREERPAREERARGSETTGRSPLDEMFGPREADEDVFGIGREQDRPLREATAYESGIEDEGPVIDYDEEARDLPVEEIGRGFGAAEQGRTDEALGEREGGRRRRRRRGRGRRGRGEGREELPSTRHEEDIEPAGEEVDFDFERDEEFDLEAELPLEEEPRSRRERGGGRQRAEGRYAAGGGERAELPPREAERGDRGGQRGRRSRRGGEAAAERGAGYRREEEESRYGGRAERGAPPPRTVHDEDIDDTHLHEDLHEDLDEGDEDHGGAPTHKKIPTWEDAVRLLIDANMASRQSNPDRGRGRGRR